MEHSQTLRQPTATDYTPSSKPMPWIISPLKENVERSSRDLSGRTAPCSLVSDNPLFREHHEADSIELFSDLFFVANLATFTAHHAIENAQALGSYIGFFTLLWFTWLQTSLFDVRFSTDSICSRIFYALSFGIMIGFAVAGPLFDTGNEGYVPVCFRSISLILMASRLFLVMQYGLVLWYVKEYPKTVVPLALTMAMLFTSAMVFLGLFFAFTDQPTHAYIGWYIVCFVEAIVVVIVSSTWRVLSFKRTHLVERIGLLTLIIMGEGIIGLTKSVAKILTKSGDVTSSDLGTIVAGGFLVFFLWVLYFDQIDPGRFGTIRVQIWTLLHYPLHVAILLTEEGSSKFILWWTMVERDPNTSGLEKSMNLNISNTIGTPIPEVRKESSVPFYEALEPIQPDEAIDLFTTVFYSFFIGSGCVLIMLGVLYWCGNGHMTWGGMASVLTRILAGIGLCLLPVISTNTAAFRTYILSPWLIPTVVLTYFVVIVADNYLVWQVNRNISPRIPHFESETESSVPRDT